MLVNKAYTLSVINEKEAIKSMKNFNDKVIVITGGATGIGYSFAKKLGYEGAKIVIASRRIQKVRDAVKRLRALGLEASGTSCDVSSREDVVNLKQYANKNYGRVDVLINNAGITQEQKPVFETDIELYRKLFEINYFGVLNCIQVFSEDMINTDLPAAIYNVGSENSLFSGVPQASGYISSKHALLALTESLREDAPQNLDVSFIVPGLVKSELADGFLKGMETDHFVEIIVEQLKNNEFYCVSHAHNMVRITKRFEDLKEAYAHYAPRYENDDEYDVRTQIKRLMKGEGK